MMQGLVCIRCKLCCSEAAVRSAHAVACCYAVLLTILNRIDANPQSGTVRTMNGHKVDCI